MNDINKITERLVKFSMIVNILNKEGIEIVSVDSDKCPVLEDKSCGYKLTHNIMTWDTYSVEEVVKMIITGRNKWLETK